VLRVRVETPCRATENLGKVKVAVLHLFPDLIFDREDEFVAGSNASLEKLRELIRNQRIRDAARSQFLAGRHGDRTVVRLNKQAAYMGLVNFTADAPLGDLVVEIESDDLGAVIDFVAESTVAPSVRPSARIAGT
jgi:predicted RNA binding protein with dsRBD fold (UPF0201 family)